MDRLRVVALLAIFALAGCAGPPAPEVAPITTASWAPPPTTANTPPTNATQTIVVGASSATGYDANVRLEATVSPMADGWFRLNATLTNAGERTYEVPVPQCGGPWDSSLLDDQGVRWGLPTGGGLEPVCFAYRRHCPEPCTVIDVLGPGERRDYEALWGGATPGTSMSEVRLPPLPGAYTWTLRFPGPEGEAGLGVSLPMVLAGPAVATVSMPEHPGLTMVGRLERTHGALRFTVEIRNLGDHVVLHQAQDCRDDERAVALNASLGLRFWAYGADLGDLASRCSWDTYTSALPVGGRLVREVVLPPGTGGPGQVEMHAVWDVLMEGGSTTIGLVAQVGRGTPEGKAT